MPDPRLDALKAKQREVWDTGDYASVADRLISEFGPRLVERSGVGPDDDVLDVAAGTGNATIPLAATGASVTALDLAPGLLETGRQRSKAAGLEINWVEGDAEALPFDDAGFDVVVSIVGVQFAPRHAVIAAELARVVRPGGRLWLFSWTPEGLIGRFLRTIGAEMPPPPEFASPPSLWGDESHVRELFADHEIELGFERETVTFPADSAEAFVDFMAESYGPLVAAREALSDVRRWEPLRDHLIVRSSDFNTAGDGSFAAPSEYLIVEGRKAG